MLKVVGRTEGYYIREKELFNFPCTDLRTIDQLWGKYSEGRFGFSVQKEIYLECDGKLDGKVWEEFGDLVGWRLNGNWIDYDDIKFNSSSPKGHLPEELMASWIGVVCALEHLSYLFSRLETCNV